MAYSWYTVMVWHWAIITFAVSVSNVSQLEGGLYMKQKKVFYSEAAYFAGLILLAFGTALMERADFGMSMIVAPAYIIHLKVSEAVSWFSFGVAEYCLQTVLILLLALTLRRFKPMYLMAFFTAIIYGTILDRMIWLIGLIPFDGMGGRIAYYLAGMVICAAGVSMLFHTYFAPEAYELVVKEVSATFGKNINITKTVYDCSSLLVSVCMSFAFWGFGHFEGVKLGTLFCALINGFLISRCTRVFERFFEFRDGLNLQKYFK